MGFIDNLLISKRIRLLSLAVIFGFIATAAVLAGNEIAHKRVDETKDASLKLASDSAEINLVTFEAQNAAASFLITRDPTFARQYRKSTETLRKKLLTFSNSDLVIEYSPLAEAEKQTYGQLEIYSLHMQSLFSMWDRAGLSEENGLHGIIRDQAHAIEAIVETLDTGLTSTLKAKVLLLTIRRTEKDFIQRLDLRYARRIDDVSNEFSRLIKENYGPTTQQAINTHLTLYQQTFKEFAELRKEIIQAEVVMNKNASDIIASIEGLRRATLSHLEDLNLEVVRIRTLFSYGAFVTVLVTALLVIGLARQVSKSISGPLLKLTSVMQSFLRNDYKVEIPNFPSHTEFGDMSAVLVKMRTQETAKIKAEINLLTAYDFLDMRVKERTLELESANAELSQFAYVISHDIKAPLRAIHNYADFLTEDLAGKLEPEQQGYLIAMSKAVTEGEQMIEDVLTLSRIGRIDTEVQVVDVAATIDSIKDLLALKSDCELVCKGSWPPLPTNGILLKQVLSNLIGNGFKSSEGYIPRRLRRIMEG